ncbi:MAG: pyridoxal phosphate-dependent aminotransferase [Ruminococcaceae bacterium]|nr:pyridoxal phosphate-dependent aminotransferase [Oscillospiraceae bacterium]
MVSKKASGVSPSPTLAIDTKFKEMKANGEDVVGFGCGEPDFDTPEHIKKAAIDAIMQGETKYTPASGTLKLRKAVAEKFLRENGLTYAPTDIVVSNGAKHSLVNAFMAICNPGDEVIIPAPYWVSYPEMVKLADGVPVVVNGAEENDFKVTAKDLASVLTDKTVAIVINSPSNPTGMVYTEKELREIADFAVENDLYVISDEIYEHLIYEGRHVSIASFGEEIKKRTIVINGVSKTFAMTGWRIGYAAACPEIAKAMANIQSHASSNPNSIAQAATVAALEGGMKDVENMKKHFVRRRDFMVDMFNSIDGVSCRRPHGAFYIMMNIDELIGRTMYGKTIKNADDFAALFLDVAKVAVVPGTGFGADNYVRWSYATSMDNIVDGIERLKKFLHAADL